MPEKSKSPSSEVAENVSDDNSEQDTQDRFEERCDLYMNQFRICCDEQKVKVAIAVVVDPEIGEDTPLVFARGHIYEQARVLSTMLRQIKMQMAKELDA